ncbi:MAG TPA: nitrilase-related carbon-nitrogen hydrolase, partial [Gammaproteobacteria bacterium]|nr:nitrilase-related carbon-nitrogen hydrolase [Gammaproteobacteria bacterium]
MNSTFRVVMAQINPLVGDVAGNVAQVLAAVARARDELHAQLVVFPELIVTGYPPEDLLFHAGLRQDVEQALARIKAEVRGIGAVLGYPLYADGRI